MSDFAGRLSCLTTSECFVLYLKVILCGNLCPLDLGAEPPRSRVFSPPNVRLIFSTSLYFESICFLLPKLAKVKVKVAILRPKAPKQSVALWSPRHQHHLHPALD